MSKAAELAKAGETLTNQPSGRKNLVTNGAMQVAQRSVSETGLGAAAGYFTLDRWKISTGASAGRLTMTQTADGPSGFANCLKLDCTTADASIAAAENLVLQQRIEGQDLQQIKKGTSDAESITVSFYVKANAVFTFGCELFDQDNTRQITKLFATTTDWVRHELTFPADTTGAFDDDNARSLDIQFLLHAGSNLTSGTLNTASFANTTDANRAVGISSFYSSTDNNFFITGVQMEIGSQATNFEHRSFGEELALCQRYHETGTFSARVSGSVVRYALAYNTTKRAGATVNVYYNSSRAAAGTINVSNSENTGWAEGGGVNFWNMEKNTGTNGDGIDYNGFYEASAEL
jgi:hypothetical protein